MSAFTHRDPSKAERWVRSYEALVASLPSGYDLSLYEYTNDISVRQLLEERRTDRDVRALWSRVVAADTDLRAVLQHTESCIHGHYPRECFWYWGYPRHSPELEADLRSIGVL